MTARDYLFIYKLIRHAIAMITHDAVQSRQLGQQGNVNCTHRYNIRNKYGTIRASNYQ